MIPLPKYVWVVPKPNGRVFYFWKKYRGTATAWPTIPLPAAPSSTEFMRRCEQCLLLEAEKSAAGWKLRFLDPAGRRHDLPDPKDKGFWAAVDKAEDVGRKLAAAQGKTFLALVTDYKNSNAYKEEISPKTRDDYDRYLNMILEAWADDPVTKLDAVSAQQAIDALQKTPSAANNFRAVLSRVIAWGIPRGYSPSNAVEKTEKFETDGTYEPWADWQFELFFEFARPGLHLAAFSGLFTGQRSADVIKMVRPAARATEMPIFAQKTGKYVPIQIHSEYRAIIDSAKPSKVMPIREEDMPLHLREDGEPWTLAGFRTAWQRDFTFTVDDAGDGTSEVFAQRKAAAMKKLRDARTVVHGLRKNAVVMLLECGCTERMVEEIVGMSAQMVAHYSKRVNSRRMAVKAMKKLESSWDEMRKTVLGNVPKVGSGG